MRIGGDWDYYDINEQGIDFVHIDFHMIGSDEIKKKTIYYQDILSIEDRRSRTAMGLDCLDIYINPKGMPFQERTENPFVFGTGHCTGCDYTAALKVYKFIQYKMDELRNGISEKKRANENEKSISIADELLKYKQLLDMSVITADEFDSIKNKLLCGSGLIASAGADNVTESIKGKYNYIINLSYNDYENEIMKFDKWYNEPEISELFDAMLEYDRSKLSKEQDERNEMLKTVVACVSLAAEENPFANALFEFIGRRDNKTPNCSGIDIFESLRDTMYPYELSKSSDLMEMFGEDNEEDDDIEIMLARVFWMSTKTLISTRAIYVMKSPPYRSISAKIMYTDIDKIVFEADYSKATVYYKGRKNEFESEIVSILQEIAKCIS